MTGTGCGARRPGWGAGPGARWPRCVLDGGHDGDHRDAFGQTWAGECDACGDAAVAAEIQRERTGNRVVRLVCRDCRMGGPVRVTPEVAEAVAFDVAADQLRAAVVEPGENEVSGSELERQRWARYIGHVSGCERCRHGDAYCRRGATLNAAWRAAHTAAQGAERRT